MTGSSDDSYSGPLSPGEKVECDRDLEELHRKNIEDMERAIDESVKQRIHDRVLSVMD